MSENESRGGENRNGGGKRRRNNHRNRNGGGNRGKGGNRRPRNPDDRSNVPRKQGRQSGGGRAPRKPAKVELTFWEKILKFFGLYKEPTRPPRATRPAGSKGDQHEATHEDQPPRKGQGRNRKPRRTPDTSQVNETRLYIGNLSFDATESDLEDLLKGVGSVRNIDIVYNRHTHRSKGFAFVQMARVEEAKRAIEVLHDQPFMGRTLIVNAAKGKDDSESQERQPRNDSEGDSEATRPARVDRKPRRPRREADRDAPSLASAAAAPIVLPGESISGAAVSPQANSEPSTDIPAQEAPADIDVSNVDMPVSLPGESISSPESKAEDVKTEETEETAKFTAAEVAKDPSAEPSDAPEADAPSPEPTKPVAGE